MSSNDYARLLEAGIEAQRVLDEFMQTDFGEPELSVEEAHRKDELLLETAIASLFASDQFIADFKRISGATGIAPDDLHQLLIDLTRELAITMARTHARFTQADLARAIRAIEQTGAPMSVEITPDGVIRIVPNTQDESKEARTDALEPKRVIVL